MDFELFVTPGLGDNSFLVASGGEAVVVDPQRDVGRFLSAAEARGVRIRHVLETHVHNDYLSGALEIHRATGAGIVAPARGRYEFPHLPVEEGDENAVGDLALRAIETPGHTPEHISYEVRQGVSDPVAVFTGGSLMVGTAGRTDLLGRQRTEELTRLQYRTLRRLAELPSAAQVLPTHGAGSFCGAGPSDAARTSTIGHETAHNRLLAAADDVEFLGRQLDGLLAYPDYYAHMARINREGPRPVADVEPVRALTPSEVVDHLRRGAWVVDGRWRISFARAHVPRSINIELDDSFCSYVGWVVPFDEPIVLILPDPERDALAAARTQLLRIGYEHVVGYLEGGLGAWQSAGHEVAAYRTAGLEEFCREYRGGRVPHVLDVRQRVEWDRSHIEGSRHLFVGDLASRTGELPRRGESWVICATGHRAALATSILDREGIPARLVEGTGVPDFLTHCLPES